MKKNRTLLVLLAALAVEAVLFAVVTRTERTALIRPLSEMPLQMGAWQMIQENVTDPETMAVLRADQVLNRTYAKGSTAANLFVAFFATQRTGQTPHSPKNCLPGSGWVQERSDIVRIPIAATGGYVEANRYVVARGDARSLVVYWYQSHGRTVASEYKAKVYVVADAIRYNRSDTSLVRVLVPIYESGVDRAFATVVDFIQEVWPKLGEFLPA